MAAPTYTVEVVVLRKTKLGETDLILTCLTTSGAQAQFVAKGARKPTSSFASRLELFSQAILLAVKGKSLDIVKEVRLVEGFPRTRQDFRRSSVAQVVCEFLCKATEPGLDVERLFPMTCAALSEMERCEEGALDALATAFLVKGFAFCGLRPELFRCVGCGEDVVAQREAGATLWFSYIDGGVVCSACRSHMECVAIEGPVFEWLAFLMGNTFVDIAKTDAGPVIFACLQVCQQWCRTHLGVSLKSLDFLLTNPLA